jgi:Trypsin
MAMRVADRGRVPGVRAMRGMALLLCAMGVLACLPAAVANARSRIPGALEVTRIPWRHGHPSPFFAAPASRRQAHAAIVGGSQISIEEAPSQVSVGAVFAYESHEYILRCGGSILGASEVLTAAHCLYDPITELPIPASQIFVLAGASDFRLSESEGQEATASEVRIHPYFEYDYEGSELPADDVAVLRLAEPLTLGSTAAAISMAPAGSLLQEGTAVKLAGFGSEIPEETPSGQLHLLGMSADYSRRCGGEADALFVCATAAGGSLCSDDDGSGLTLSASATLVGVADTSELIDGKPCQNGALGAFMNLSAPEIRDFIEGSDSPPRAPRGGGAIISGVPKVGHSFACEPGSWSNSPAYTYVFVNSASGAVLQRGSSSTYQLSAEDAGQSILCEVEATNAGGTGIGRTPGLGPIEAVPPMAESPATTVSVPSAALPPPVPASTPTVAAAVASEVSSVSLASTKFTVQPSGLAFVKLVCEGSASCHGRLTLTAQRTVEVRGKKATRTLSMGNVEFVIAGNRTTVVKIKLSASGRSALRADHGSLSGRLEVLGLETEPTQAETVPVHLVEQAAHVEK